jgi:hypothetical protein
MESRVKDIARWLRIFISPDQLTEFRALGVKGSETHAGWFQGDELDAMAQAALALESKSRGLYFTPNPLRQVPGNSAIGEVGRRGPGECAKDEDIAKRAWLLVDIDPVRFGPDGNRLQDQAVPTTEVEREAGFQVALGCQAILDGAGFKGHVLASSGNGWHLCYPWNAPNDEQAKQKHREILLGLERLAGNERAHVDAKTFNAARIWKLPGTQSRKGIESDGRLHNYSHVI